MASFLLSIANYMGAPIFVVIVVTIKAMRSVKRYACYVKNPEFRIILMSVITVINIIIPLR